MSKEFGLQTPEGKEPVYRIGQILRHLASHNRYQEYHILDITWDPDLLMGAGGFRYTINFYEWDGCDRRHQTQNKQDWVTAEIVLPIHNLILWTPRES